MCVTSVECVCGHMDVACGMLSSSPNKTVIKLQKRQHQQVTVDHFEHIIMHDDVIISNACKTTHIASAVSPACFN